MGENWKEFIKTHKGLHYEKPQEDFYNRAKDFIIGDDNVMINQGGMGLGKTLATIGAMNFKNNNYIATPFRQIKNEWSKEFKRCNIKHAVWHSKKDCCIKKMENIKFSMNNCNDSCGYREHLEEDRKYNQQCDALSNELNFPLSIEKYYRDNGCQNCLLPITRNRVNNDNIVIGDFFGIFLPKMFNYVTKQNQFETDLHIDEGHMLPSRAKQFLSKQLSIGFMINRIKKTMDDDSYFLENFDKKFEMLNFLEQFETLKKSLMTMLEGKRDKIDKLSYSEFLLTWRKINNTDFKMFLKEVNFHTGRDKNPDIETPKTFEEVYNFFMYWEDKKDDNDYNAMFQYITIKNEDIILKINCSDTGSFLRNNLSIFNKVHILSGTIPDKEYYKKMIGIDDCIFKEPINSYSIKNNVINFGVGNFTSACRNETYNMNDKLLKKMLRKFNGRTLIYTQSKHYCNKLCYMLDEFNVFNLNQESDDQLTQVKENFNSSSNGVAVTYITGKVEGQNFIDDNGNTVENLIIYGYPYMRRGIEFDDAVAHWTKKLKGDYKKAEEYVQFFPVSSTLYQAAMRAKRDELDNPVIILWSKEFSPGNPGYKYAYPELKGEVVYEPQKVLDKIMVIQNGRIN